jgi:hypothetical protein
MNTTAKKSVFDFFIKPKWHSVPKDSKKVPRPENNTASVQRERMSFYLKQMGYKQKLPSDVKNSFQFEWNEVDRGNSRLYMTREGVLFVPKERIENGN